MEIRYSYEAISQSITDVVVFFCMEETFQQDETLKVLDQSLEGWILKTVEREKFTGKKTQSVLLPTYGKMKAHRILLLGMGSQTQLHPSDYRAAAIRALRGVSIPSVETVTFVMPKEHRFLESHSLEFITQGILLGQYRFDKYLTAEKKNTSLRQVVFLFPKETYRQIPEKEVESQISRAQILTNSINRSRDWVNEPSSEMTPAKMAQVAEQIAKENPQLKVQILSAAECEQRGMGLLLAVGKGSDLPPYFIHLSYHPPKHLAKSGKRVALVGKGITFDSGGVCIKTPPGMMDMKADMAGGASVIATLDAIAKLGCPYEVHGFIACAENMVSGRAYRLRDVVTSMSGKTVEITNTDAEGRLVMADAITYAIKEVKPNEIIDIATLTGACIVALGPYMAGLMSNQTELVNRILTAAHAAGEEMWHLPIPEFTQDVLKSDVADLKNAGDRNGGALSAGRFLREFVEETPWAHLDIAGPSFLEKDYGYLSKGATGFSVATLVEYLTRTSTG